MAPSLTETRNDNMLFRPSQKKLVRQLMLAILDVKGHNNLAPIDVEKDDFVTHFTSLKKKAVKAHNLASLIGVDSPLPLESIIRQCDMMILRAERGSLQDLL